MPARVRSSTHGSTPGEPFSRSSRWHELVSEPTFTYSAPRPSRRMLCAEWPPIGSPATTSWGSPLGVSAPAGGGGDEDVAVGGDGDVARAADAVGEHGRAEPLGERDAAVAGRARRLRRRRGGRLGARLGG